MFVLQECLHIVVIIQINPLCTKKKSDRSLSYSDKFFLTASVLHALSTCKFPRAILLWSNVKFYLEE